MRMTQYIGLPLLFLMATTRANGPEFSKTYLTIHPYFDACSPERLTLFRNQYDTRENGHGGAFELVVFGGKTTKACEMSTYFMPSLRNYARVGEDFSTAMRTFNTDLNALHLGILTQPANVDLLSHVENLTFESTVRFYPQQEVVGLGFAWQQRIHKNWWFDITAPVMWVKNNVCFDEHITNAGGSPASGYTSVRSALGTDNTKLQYGHITNKCLKKAGVSQVDLRIGRDFTRQDFYKFGMYLGVTIPTGNKPTQRCLFEPIIGNNHHFGVMIGAYGNTILHQSNDERVLSFVYEAASRYLAHNTQCRSFDLIGKPWSRYMSVWPSQELLPNPNTDQGVSDGLARLNYLINYSTLSVQVSPKFDLMTNAAFLYHSRIVDCEIGYNIYARKAESLALKSTINSDIGLAAVNYWLLGNRTPVTRSLANPGSAMLDLIGGSGNVDQQIQPDTPVVTYRQLTCNDLDLRSGACPGILNQTIYASLEKTWSHLKVPAFLGCGASYECANDNTTASRWGAWIKCGICI